MKGIRSVITKISQKTFFIYLEDVAVEQLAVHPLLGARSRAERACRGSLQGSAAEGMQGAHKSHKKRAAWERRK